MKKYYPRDKHGRVLREGDFVLVDFIWESDGKTFENEVGIIENFEKYLWSTHWIIKVKFLNDENITSSHEVLSGRCEWLTKRRHIRERKLFLLKMEKY